CQTSLESFRFHEASHYLYHFFWHELCDWYLEFLKPRILDSTELEDHQLSFLVVHFVFDQALKLLHPFMPFITEELWQRLPHEGDALAIAPFPVSREEFIDLEAEKSIATLEDVIVKIRNVRAEMNIQPSRKIDVNLASSDPTIVTILQEGLIHILNLARCANVNILSSLKNLEHSARRVALGVEIEIPLVGLIDFEAERAKLEKEIAGAEKEMFQIQQKLSNPDFLSGAPESVVQSNRERLLLATDKFQKLRESLSRL
ncbi:MAG TPA: class I tRNA ligase family protein, partial [Terriglobia bacterium]|nr:class I tRNA ligase family protein [Terriglobia bacterium]